jgi:hypothetical protein
LQALLRRAVSGLRSIRPNGRQNIGARGGSMSRKLTESHCTLEIGHKLLTEWTENTEIDSPPEIRHWAPADVDVEHRAKANK